jgi:mannose-6-phosphate isomerase-like protein (cupin superfamily)
MRRAVFLLFLFFSLPGFGQMSKSAGKSPLADTSEVKVFHNDIVTKSFASGGTLASGENYLVMTAHRTSPGQVEVHRKFTDIFYIVQGSVTLITGGHVLDENTANPDEPRGTSIEGGHTQDIAAGDVVVIPAGVPHWMKEVKGTLLYFVVKVQTPDTGKP